MSFAGKQITDEVLDYGLDDVVPNDEIEAYNAMPKPATGGPMSPEQASALYLESLIQLDREVRVAGLIFAAANYAAGQSETLSGNSQWSDYANSNPLSYIMAALDKPLIRPNVAVLGQLTYTALRQHPKVVQAVNGSGQGAGTVTRQQLAELLEVQTVLVGSSFVNTARKGRFNTQPPEGGWSLCNSPRYLRPVWSCFAKWPSKGKVRIWVCFPLPYFRWIND